MFRKIGQIFSIVFDTRIDFQIAGQHFTHTLNCKQSFFGNSVILPTEKKIIKEVDIKVLFLFHLLRFFG